MSWPNLSPLRSAQAVLHWYPVAIEIPCSSRRQARVSSARRGAATRESGRKRPRNYMASIQSKCRTLSRSAATLLTNWLAPPESDRNAPRNCYSGTARLMASLIPIFFKLRLRYSAFFRLIATMDAKAPLPSLTDQEPGWASASTLARRWRLNQLADRLDEKVRHP
jgi:hypothetical protein